MLNRLYDPQKSGIAATLSKSLLFLSLETDELLKIAEISRILTFQKGRVITKAGERLPGVFVIQSGIIKVFTPGPSKMQNLYRTAGAGACFGLMALVPGEVAMVSCTASNTVRLVYIPRRALTKLYLAIPKLPVNVLTTLTCYMRILLARTQRLKCNSIEMRLAWWLLEQPPEPVDHENKKTAAFAKADSVVTIGITKAELANDLGVTQQSLSRALSHFRNEGIIYPKGKSIYILDRGKLAARAKKSMKLKPSDCAKIASIKETKT